MRIIALALIAAISMVAAMTGAAIAETEAGKDAAVPEAVKQVNPHIKEMNEKAKELAKVLTTEESETLGYVRENYGVLGSIDIARKSVEEAVKLCAEKNPGMAGDIDKRYESWHVAIGEQTGKQRTVLDKVVTKEYFRDPAKVRDYLDTLDKAAEFANTSVEKTIVTTKEACTNLMNSMDETQEVIIGLVKDLDWPEKAEGKSTP